MRDPKRIDRMLDLLRAYWTAAPDLRLGQIVGNFTPRHTYTVQDEMGEYPTERPGDSYYVEDDVIEAALSKALAARPAPERAEPAGSDEVRPCDACMVPCEERGPILPSCPPVLAPIIAPDSCDECQVPQDARHPCPPCSTPSPPHIPGVCDADLHPLCPLCGARVTSTFGCLTCKGLPSGFGPFIPHEHDPPLAAPLPATQEWWTVIQFPSNAPWWTAVTCDAAGEIRRFIGAHPTEAAARADGAASGLEEWRGKP